LKWLPDEPDWPETAWYDGEEINYDYATGDLNENAQNRRNAITGHFT